MRTQIYPNYHKPPHLLDFIIKSTYKLNLAVSYKYLLNFLLTISVTYYVITLS
jgi:hypothetical protein